MLITPAGAKVVVVGLGRFGGGVGVTRWLVEQGAQVTVNDFAPPDQLSESVAQLADLPVNFALGHHDPQVLEGCDWVVLNPAIDKRRSALFQAVRERGLPWTTEISLFCELCPARVIAVTGSFGKSTTCAMLAEAARAAGSAAFERVYLGGNIGGSLLGELSFMSDRDLVVLELSSAQLEDLPAVQWLPSVAAITNLFPHHLDRYDGFEDYARTKFNIFRAPRGRPMGNPGQLLGREEHAKRLPSRPALLVVGDLDPEARGWLNGEAAAAGVEIREAASAAEVGTLRVWGEHNRRNAALALTVCRHLNVSEQASLAAIQGFPGLPHRLQWVATIGGVEWINDSKATSPQATVQSLKAIDPPVVLLVGGRRKDVCWSELVQCCRSTCRAVISFGEAGSVIAEALAGTGSPVQVHRVDSLVHAVSVAEKIARPGERVLLSPGCQSFDAYGNYAERGEHFRRLVAQHHRAVVS